MKDSKRRLKLIAGGIVVAAAFLIILPGLINYVAGIGRLIVLIVVALGLAYALNLLLARNAIDKAKRKNEADEAGSSAAAGEDTPGESGT